MATLVVPANGEDVTAESVAQLVELWQGLRYIATTHITNDGATYSETIRNLGTGGRGLIVLSSAGATLFAVDESGVQVGNLLSPHMTGAVIDSGGLVVNSGSVATRSATNTSSSFALQALQQNASYIIQARGDGAVFLGNAGGTVGFNGTTPIAKPTITGSRGGNAGLASLLTAGNSMGLWLDSTTA